MSDTTIQISLSLFLELSECKERLRVIRDFTNKQRYNVNRENLAILGGFELETQVDADADM